MEQIVKKLSIPYLVCIVLSVYSLNACTQKMSESINDDSIGVNGSFEFDKNGLPVNWLVYSPKTVKTGDFDIDLDQKHFKEGKQSLKFTVRNCSDKGGRLSPGISQEFEAQPNENYSVKLWVKNEDTKFRIKVDGVDAFNKVEGSSTESSETIAEWKLYEYEYTMPKNMDRIRLEINVLEPGTFWVDDIKIEPVK